MATSEQLNTPLLHPQGMQKVIFCVLISQAIFLVMGGLSMYLPSLPLLEQTFHRDEGDLQFTVSIYLMFFALSQLPLGLLSDLFGRKPVFIFANTLFLTGTALAIFADNYHWFIISRGLQGLGAGGLSTLTKTMGRDVYTGNELTQITTYLGIVVVLAPFLSLIIGAHVDQWAGWQGSFYILAALAGLTLLLSVLLLPETLPKDRRQKITPAILQQDIHSALRNTLFLRYAVIFSMINTIDVAYNTVGTFYYQNTLHLSSVEFAWLSGSLAAGLFLGLFLCRKIKEQWNDILGCVLFIFVSVLLLFVSIAEIDTVPSLLVPMFIFSIGMGIFFPYAFSKALSAANQRIGLYSALMGSFQIGVSFAASWFISLTYDGSLLFFAINVTACTLIMLLLTILGNREI